MNYALSGENGVTSALPEGSLYLERRPIFDQSYARNLNYGLMEHFQVASVSWWNEVAVADMQLEQTFKKLAEEWKRDTMNVSSIGKMILHPAYQRIIGFGPKATALILNQMKKEPDFWFWALKSITGEDPVTEELLGDLEAMTKAWLDWGREHGGS